MYKVPELLSRIHTSFRGPQKERRSLPLGAVQSLIDSRAQRLETINRALHRSSLWPDYHSSHVNTLSWGLLIQFNEFMSKDVALTVKSHQKKLWRKIRSSNENHILILWVSGGRGESVRNFFSQQFPVIWPHIKEKQEVCSAKPLTRKELESLYYFHFLWPVLNNSKDADQLQILIPDKKSRKMDGIWRLAIKQKGEMTRIKSWRERREAGRKWRKLGFPIWSHRALNLPMRLVPPICSLSKYRSVFQISSTVRSSMALTEVEEDRSATFPLNLLSEPEEDIRNNKQVGGEDFASNVFYQSSLA